MIDRRALIGAGIAAAVAARPAIARERPFGNDRPIGINLYMLATAYRRDIDATLRAVAAIGYREVETNFDVHSADTIRPALDRAGLRCSNIILLPTAMRGGMSLATDPGVLADAVHKVGARFITTTLFTLPDGVSMRPAPGESVAAILARISNAITADDWKRNADFLNRTGATLARHGLRFAHHNHNAEFRPLGRTDGLSILLDRTDPALVDFEMDAGWVVAAGHDPVKLLRAYPGRFRLMHVKDVAATSLVNTTMQMVSTEVGAGIVDWRRLLRQAIDSGVRHFAVEQEPPYAMPEIDAARKSFDHLATLML